MSIQTIRNGCVRWADAPHGLFYRGELPDEKRQAVAIIGSRVCTHYGRQIAEQLAEQIAFAGGIVISGAAYGIDGRAHSGKHWRRAERAAPSSGAAWRFIIRRSIQDCFSVWNRKAV